MAVDSGPSPEFLGGVIEGFYGQTWTQPQRLTLFDQMVAWGLNTYFYAPKDDVKHRAIWRESYTGTELAGLAELIDACSDRGIKFIYGLSPGLDIRFSAASEVDAIKRRFEQLVVAGGRHFALLFDDLPGEMQADDRRLYDSVAAAQCDVTNQAFAWLRDRAEGCRLLFCPTPYCGRMDHANHGGERYLETIGELLAPEIDVFWTGPEIVSREITVDSITAVARRIRRPPVIWDNLHANDYDLRRLYCGPYAGRPLELKQHVRGILTNPNNEFPINFIPLRTFGHYLSSDGGYEPRAAFEAALDEWLDGYGTIGQPVPREGLQLLADCYYLPFQQGLEAENLEELVTYLVRQPVDAWGDRMDRFVTYRNQVQSTFDRLTELKSRELFYAWSRRVWELNEELQLLEGFLTAKQAGGIPAEGVPLNTHLPGTYRGGAVARLQRLLSMDDQGRIRAVPPGPAR